MKSPWLDLDRKDNKTIILENLDSIITLRLPRLGSISWLLIGFDVSIKCQGPVTALADIVMNFEQVTGFYFEFKVGIFHSIFISFQ